MAIIQISRIQVRRGKENNGTGVPRLASGEFGWAVDTQRLFIGPGSEQEGCHDSLNNVRILTAKDNILSLVDQYQYKTVFDEFGNVVTTVLGTVPQSIQQRLDDFVSAASFGVVGNGLADDTDSLQAAIDTLFGINNDQGSRSILYVPAGTYRITRSLSLPSYARIVGSGIENTIIINQNTDDDGTVFKTIADINIGAPNQDQQARYIKITDLSMNVVNGNVPVLLLNSCRDSEFRNLKLSGTRDINNGPELAGQIAISLESISNSIICKDNLFENIEITNLVAGIDAPGRIINNKFKNINFYDLEIGIVFGADPDTVDPVGPELNVIENCQFDFIDNHAIHVVRGNNNISKNNRFLNVGNGGGLINETPVIEFGGINENDEIIDTIGNISVNDYFQRTDLSSDPASVLEYLPEVQGRTRYENLFMTETSVGGNITGEPLPVFRLPAVDAGSIEIDYIFTDTNLPVDIRKGKLTILLTATTNDTLIEDDFTSSDNVNMSSLEFFAERNSNYIMISAKNNLTNSRLYYTIKTKT